MPKVHENFSHQMRSMTFKMFSIRFQLRPCLGLYKELATLSYHPQNIWTGQAYSRYEYITAQKQFSTEKDLKYTKTRIS